MIAPNPYMSGHRPLFWTWFGGPGGSFLKSLVKITFVRLDRIDFIFNDPEVPTACRSFGHDSCEGMPTNYGIKDILIDGPGGENIQTIELYHVGVECSSSRSREFREGYFIWLRVPYPRFQRTNCLGRHCANGENRYTRTVGGCGNLVGNLTPVKPAI